jgi:hypothetical protein
MPTFCQTTAEILLNMIKSKQKANVEILDIVHQINNQASSSHDICTQKPNWHCKK